MIFDPIADMISTIKNGYLSNKDEVRIPFSLYKQEIAKVLIEENYLLGMEVVQDEGKVKKKLILKLKYEDKKPVLTDIKQVSKTSLRVYVPYKHLPKVLGGLGFSVVSTPKGVVSTAKAKKLHLGGEVICNVW